MYSGVSPLVYFRILMVLLILSTFPLLALASSQDSASQSPSAMSIAEQNLVILQYHHVDSTTPKSTSVSPEVFESHMALLAANYNVVSLVDAIKKIKNNESLPNKSVAITFDDGYTNILENAHPILSKYGFAYTVFVNPAIIGDSSSQLSWDQVKQMQPLATFANHTLDHAHLLEMYGNENQEQWLTRVMNDINQAEELLTEKLGYSNKWLAYPYGEYNLALKDALLASGYIGFGQQSGAISSFSDFGALPRFPAAGIYASIPSLTVKLNSLAMPVDVVEPAQVAYSADNKLDTLNLTVSNKDIRLTQFACYFKGEKLKFLGNNNTIKVKVDYTMSPGRTRINCTAPSLSENNRFYWYSHPLFVATHEGEFLD